MNLKRVAQDLPILVQNYLNNAKIGNEDTLFSYYKIKEYLDKKNYSYK